MRQLWIPSVHGNAIAGQAHLCDMQPRAATFAAAWMALLGEDAKRLHCDKRLVAAAQAQAEFLARNDFVPGDAHRGEGGSYANERIAATGYKLPDWWSLQANYVESAIRAWSSPGQAAYDLAHHDTHYDHMHFAAWWYKWDFCVWGVGAAEAVIDRGGIFYCVLTAPREA